MPDIQHSRRTRPLATDRRWLAGLAALLAVVTIGVMATAMTGSMIQTGVRAYVGGEGLWSKAEKNAVIHLERLVATHAEAEWQGYLTERDVILGDRRARLELETSNPDPGVVSAGFVAGGNATDDVASMAMLFRVFRHLSYIERAITIWTDADAEFDRLDAVAGEVHVAIQRDDPIVVARLSAELNASNDRLTLLEYDFSHTLGEGARWVQTVLLVVMAAILGLLIAITAVLGRFMLRRLRAADREAAETLRADETRLRLLLDHLPAIVWTTDADLLVTSVTGDGLARLGLDGPRMVGRPLGDLVDPATGIAGEDPATAERWHREALRGRSASYRTLIADRTFQVHVEPLLVEGRMAGVIGLGLDLSDRLALEARLERSTRLESIGRLAGGVAHDFNNLLTAISGYADLLTTSLPEGEQRRDAEQIRRAGQRAADLTGQLLAFGRRQVLKPELVQANDVIDEMRYMLERLVGEDVVLDLQLDPDLPRVMADPGQLEQVIVNLAVNARDAMPQGGSLTIATSRTTMVPTATGSDQAGRGPSIDAILIGVRDTGSGMDQATQARMFEPFFTTKDRGRGTGLGLSTVYGIVDQTGGSIQVESAPGLGTAFTILLAAAPYATATRTGLGARPAPALVAAEASATPAPVRIARRSSVDLAVRPLPGAGCGDPDRGGRRPTILVAEDEVAVRELVVHVLTAAGCTVIAAIDGRDALRQAELHPRLDALVSDVMMPHLNGPELAARLRERQPDLPVLFMSGFTGDVLGERGMVESGVQLLDKPFLPSDLIERVRAILPTHPIPDGAVPTALPAASPELVVA